MALRIGTCSWKYDSWEGLVYSTAKPANYLDEYARQYDTVEVDQWFWSLFENSRPKLPHPDDVENYRRSVPPAFMFSIKIPNSITLTHYYSKSKGAPLKVNPYFLSGELFQEFLQRLNPLKERSGPLMFQFEYLNKQKMASAGEFREKFAAFIAACPAGYDYAVEIRNPNYLNQDYFAFLKEHKLRHVFVQGYYMPPVFDIYRSYADYIDKATVIRLMGPDRKEIEEKSGFKWNRIFDPKDDELSGIVAMIKNLEERDVDVYLNVNNHYEGCAPLTIRKIRQMLENPG